MPCGAGLWGSAARLRLCVQEWATAKFGSWSYERIDNSVPAAKRHEAVLRFNKEGR